MEIFLTAEAWISLLTLTFLEIVLGVDNILFISIVSNSLPEERQRPAQRIGIVVAMFFRIALLIALVWLMQELTEPFFYVAGMGFSFREIILAAGGLFLVAKSVSEIHERMEVKETNEKTRIGNQFFKVVAMIIVLNIVFSFDSILTAIGLSNQLIIMIVAIVLSMFVMITFAGAISRFISKHPTLEILALSFLILIGFMLMLEGVHIEVPKGYIYFAVFFSLMVEIINMKIRKKGQVKE
ncbi:hypothetical protein SDC9_54605 [bioreactor metagenome]|uniref:Membrane protein TerC n=1 Tax=bioreactor metagenome TaxID=1076179 RepID=A0A644X1Y0_9ZZZZ